MLDVFKKKLIQSSKINSHMAVIYTFDVKMFTVRSTITIKIQTEFGYFERKKSGYR